MWNLKFLGDIRQLLLRAANYVLEAAHYTTLQIRFQHVKLILKLSVGSLPLESTVHLPLSASSNSTRMRARLHAKRYTCRSPLPETAPGQRAQHLPKKPNPTPIPPPNQTLIEEISDLLDNLPVNACVELTRRLLTAVPTLPSGAARSRAVLKIVILFVAEYGSTP